MLNLCEHRQRIQNGNLFRTRIFTCRKLTKHLRKGLFRGDDVAFHAGIMPSPFVALIYSTLAIWARVVSYALEHAAALLLGLASDAAPASSPLPTVFVNIQVLNREQKLAEVEVKTKAEVQQNLNHLGPLGSWAADLAGKTAAGLTKMAVSNEDLGMSVGMFACQCSTGLLQQIGVQSQAEVVYAEASLAVVQCSMVKVDLPTLVKAVTSQSEVGIGIARVWGFCWVPTSRMAPSY